jgi:MFS transporter, FSR family, fosmidomycin resistance protein
VLVAGGVAFAVSVALTALAGGFWVLLLALAVGNPATGAFVSLAQATLMDADPGARERNMARWTLAGSFGYVGGPVLLVGVAALGLGWRVALAALAVAALPLAPAGLRFPRPGRASGESPPASVRQALVALRRPEVVRCLALLEAADLLLDVFHGFLALYLVDVTGASAAGATLGVGIWTGGGLVGDWLLLLAVRRLSGARVIRGTALVAVFVYPAFLLAPTPGSKLGLLAALGVLNSGWYALPKAWLYESLPGRSGAAVAAGGVGGLLGAAAPLLLGLLAGAAGLGATMWVLLGGPVVLLTLGRHE